MQSSPVREPTPKTADDNVNELWQQLELQAPNLRSSDECNSNENPANNDKNFPSSNHPPPPLSPPRKEDRIVSPSMQQLFDHLSSWINTIVDDLQNNSPENYPHHLHHDHQEQQQQQHNHDDVLQRIRPQTFATLVYQSLQRGDNITCTVKIKRANERDQREWNHLLQNNNNNNNKRKKSKSSTATTIIAEEEDENGDEKNSEILSENNDDNDDGDVVGEKIDAFNQLNNNTTPQQREKLYTLLFSKNDRRRRKRQQQQLLLQRRRRRLRQRRQKSSAVLATKSTAGEIESKISNFDDEDLHSETSTPEAGVGTDAAAAAAGGGSWAAPDDTMDSITTPAFTTKYWGAGQGNLVWHRPAGEFKKYGVFYSDPRKWALEKLQQQQQVEKSTKNSSPGGASAGSPLQQLELSPLEKQRLAAKEAARAEKSNHTTLAVAQCTAAWTMFRQAEGDRAKMPYFLSDAIDRARLLDMTAHVPVFNMNKRSGGKYGQKAPEQMYGK